MHNTGRKKSYKLKKTESGKKESICANVMHLHTCISTVMHSITMNNILLSLQSLYLQAAGVITNDQLSRTVYIYLILTRNSASVVMFTDNLCSQGKKVQKLTLEWYTFYLCT